MRRLALVLVLALLPLSSQAQEAAIDEIAIQQPWARATAGATPNGAAFMSLRNEGSSADFLVAVASNVAKRVELHQHTMTDGVMQMRRVEKVEVPAGGETALKPGGYHVMLIGLVEPLKSGEQFPLSLTFKQAGQVTVEVTVGSVGAMSAEDGNQSGSRR